MSAVLCFALSLFESCSVFFTGERYGSFSAIIYDVKTSLSKKKLDKDGYMLLIENALRPRGRDAERPAIFEEYEN